MKEWNRNNVILKIKKSFPNKDPEVILKILKAHNNDSDQIGVARMHLAILKLCEGNMDKLIKLVEIARQDFRDVISPAEYPKFWEIGFFGVQKLTEEEKEALIQKDLQQYLDWLQDGF